MYLSRHACGTLSFCSHTLESIVCLLCGSAADCSSSLVAMPWYGDKWIDSDDEQEDLETAPVPGASAPGEEPQNEQEVQTAGVPGVPGVPDVPGAPGVPGVPDVPGVPGEQIETVEHLATGRVIAVAAICEAVDVEGMTLLTILPEAAKPRLAVPDRGVVQEFGRHYMARRTDPASDPSWLLAGAIEEIVDVSAEEIRYSYFKTLTGRAFEKEVLTTADLCIKSISEWVSANRRELDRQGPARRACGIMKSVCKLILLGEFPCYPLQVWRSLKGGNLLSPFSPDDVRAASLDAVTAIQTFLIQTEAGNLKCV
jgi:hypothetical protein